MHFPLWVSVQYSLYVNVSAHNTHVSDWMFQQGVTIKTWTLKWHIQSSEQTHFEYDLVYNLHDGLSKSVFQNDFELTTPLGHCVSVTCIWIEVTYEHKQCYYFLCLPLSDLQKSVSEVREEQETVLQEEPSCWWNSTRNNLMNSKSTIMFRRMPAESLSLIKTVSHHIQRQRYWKNRSRSKMERAKNKQGITLVLP